MRRGTKSTTALSTLGGGVNAVNRESGAVQGEATVEQYSDIVEKYFKAITKPAKKP